MSVDHLYFEWYVDDECLGLWIRHKCLNGEVKEWHPDSRWKLTLDGPRPSLNCDDCGRHTILTNADRATSPSALTDRRSGLASRTFGPGHLHEQEVCE